MQDLTPSSVQQRLLWRYACKQFDASRKITHETWDALEQSLVLAPSSFGLQPWRFVVITDQAVKEQLPALSWNQTQPRDCSHMVVIAARKTLDAAYVDHFIESVAEQRGTPREALVGYRNVIVNSVNGSEGRHFEWNARQAYIALGQLMTAAAMLGVDTCPMEGIEFQAYDRVLGLADSDYSTVVACALGYRAASDKYATAVKVRFPATEIVTHIR